MSPEMDGVAISGDHGERLWRATAAECDPPTQWLMKVNHLSIGTTKSFRYAIKVLLLLY